MLSALFFFLASWFFGLTILEIGQIILPSLFRNVLGLVLGVVLNTLAIFFASFLFGLNFITSLAILLLTFLPSLFFLFKKTALPNFLDQFDFKKNWTIVLAFAALSFLLIQIFNKSIYIDSNRIIAGNRLVWTDWPVHIAIISSFVHGNNFPPENPLYSGQIISYPFFSDFLSSVLESLGASLKISLIIPGIVLSLASIALIYFLGVMLTAKKHLVLIGVIIGIFWGGLGFMYFIKDLITSGNFLETLKFPPYEYTFLQDKGFWFFSFLYSELLPQRAFLFGLPMFFSALILLILGIYQSERKYLALSGYLVGVMPFFHMHSYLSFLMISSVFIFLTFLTNLKEQGIKYALSKFKDIIVYFTLPIVGLGLIQAPVFLSVNLSQSLGLNWGWMKGNENFIVFWFKNSGFFWPLMILAFFILKKNTMARDLGLSSIVLFILPNIFRFASWPYDNLKIMTYWYLIGAFFVAISLSFVFQKGFLGKILSIILFVTLTLSGGIEIGRIMNTQKTQIPLWSKNDVELADTLKEVTPPKSLILTAAIHDHPSTALAGRKTIIGFPGNAWAWGLPDWYQREMDVHKIFRADSTYTFNLMKKYKVDYVLISPREIIFEPNLNEEYFLKNYPLVIQGEDYKLFQIK